MIRCFKFAQRVTSSVQSKRMLSAPAVRIPETGALINNEWQSGSNTFETVNPATEELLSDVINCTQIEVDAAVEAARDAFYNPESAWSQMGGYERGQCLNRLANLMEENIEELAMLEVLDNGKPYAEALNLDLPLSIQCYRYYAGWADKIHGSVINPSGPVGKGI